MARPGPARRCAPGQSPTGPTLALSGSLAQSLFRSKNLGDEEVDCSCYLKLGIPTLHILYSYLIMSSWEEYTCLIRLFTMLSF